MQRNLKAEQLFVAGGAKIDRCRRAFRNGVDAGAAVNGAQIERRTGLLRQTRCGQGRQRGGQRRDRVRCPRIGEAVAARTSDRDLETTASDRLGYGGVGSRAIEHDMSGDAAGQRPLRIEMADSPQVAFALLADIAQKQELRGKLDPGADESMGEGQNSNYPRTVVAGSRSFQAVTSVRRVQD